MSGIVLRAPLVPEQSQQYCLRGTRNPELAPSALFVHFIDTARLLLQYKLEPTMTQRAFDGK